MKTIHEIIDGFDSSITAMRAMFTRQNEELQSAKALAIALETDCAGYKRRVDSMQQTCDEQEVTIQQLEKDIATLEDQNTTAIRQLDEQSQFHEDRRAVAMAARTIQRQLDELIGAIG